MSFGDSVESQEVKKRPATLLICFSRPTLISQTLQLLKDSGIKRVYISIDGPTSSEIREKQREISRISASFHSKTFQVYLRQLSSNLGVALGVISAVDWFFSHEKDGLILEEDIVISERFIDFGQWAINQFASQPRCLIAGGFFINNTTFSPDGPFICRYPMIWGWATNQANWRTMREMIFAPKHFSLDKLFSRSKQFWYVGAKRASLGIVDTWDIQLAYEFLHQGYFCILPDVPLCQNVGFDEFATHTKTPDPILTIELDRLRDFTNAVLSKNIEYAAYYQDFLERKVYRISYRNLFSVYKLAIQSYFIKTKPPSKSLAEREKLLLSQDSSSERKQD